MKKVYTIHGSEEGLIGIYTNKKKAYENAMKYLYECENPKIPFYEGEISVANRKNLDATYSNLCKVMKGRYRASIETGIHGYGTSVEITERILNVDIY